MSLAILFISAGVTAVLSSFFVDLGKRTRIAQVRLLWLKEALDDFSADEVLIDDLGDVLDGDTAVPDLLGIDDDGDTALALVQASGIVRTDDLREAARGQLFL